MTPEETRAYMKARYYDQRDGFIAYLGGRCNRCGSTERLEIDHMDRRDKSFTVAALWPIDKLPGVYEELEKCQLLCRECHIEKTAEESRGERGWTHGTCYGWMKKKCRCGLCMSWAGVRNAKRRQGKRRYGAVSHHGERLHYTRGCRCSECRAANAAYARSLKAAAC